jgi:hypothetical protein
MGDAAARDPGPRGVRRLVLALAVAALLAGPGRALAAAPVAVQTSFSPASIFFADRVTARVDVVADRRQVDAGSIVVEPSFGPWTEVGPRRSASAESSTVARRTWWYTLACLTLECVPKTQAVQAFRLPPVTVTAKTRNGGTLTVSKPWPALDVSGRFPPPPNTDVSPLFRVVATVPAAAFRVGPGPLALGLDGVGALLIAGALGFAGYELYRRVSRRGRRVDAAPPLARALALVRDSQSRGVDDRRRAAGLLARTLPDDANGLESDASQVAWSAPEPTPARLEELARTVEESLEERE